MCCLAPLRMWQSVTAAAAGDPPAFCSMPRCAPCVFGLLAGTSSAHRLRGACPRLLSFCPAPRRLAQRLAPGCPRMCHMTVPNPGAFAQAAVPPGASFLTLRWLQAPSSGPPARVLRCLPPQRQDQRVAFASEPVSPANLCSAQGRGPHLTPAGLPAQGTAGAGYTVRLRKSRDGGSPLAVSPPFCS